MSDQPKSEIRRGEPTGEWTGMRILSEFQKVDGIDVYALADAIKAALDAEREKREAAEQRAANYHRQILDENEMTKQLLAAEREKWKSSEDLLKAIVRERPVQDKAASAFYRVRQKAKDALAKVKP